MEEREKLYRVGKMHGMLASTTNEMIDKLGPMPNELGESFQKVMISHDIAALMALGLHMDDAIKSKDWEELARGLRSIEKNETFNGQKIKGGSKQSEE
jgi:hypothetical protein